MDEHRRLFTGWKAGSFFFLLAAGIRTFWLAHSGDWNQPLQHWMMEEVAIAQHIAAGHGFLSPYAEYEAAKPHVLSALSAPAYPHMLASLLRLCGTGRELEAYRISMILNGLVGSAAVGLLAGIARVRFGLVAGLATGLLGALLPPLVYRSPSLWDTPYVMFAISVILTLAGAKTSRIRQVGSALIGVILGVFALFNPIVLPLVPPIALIFLFRESNPSLGVQKALCICLACAAALAPWTFRNYSLYGHFVPIRNCMGREIWMGAQKNCDGTSQTVGTGQLTDMRSESSLLHAMGEDAFNKMRMAQAISLIKDNPGAFASKTLNRIRLYWIGDSRKTPFGDAKRGFVVFLKMTALGGLLAVTLIGIFCDPDRHMRWFGLYALLVLPIPYYITHVCPQYRVPVMILEAYWAGVGTSAILFKAKAVFQKKTCGRELDSISRE